MKKLFLFLFALIAANGMYADGGFARVQVGDLWYEITNNWWDENDVYRFDTIAVVTYEHEGSLENYDDLTSVVIPASITYEDKEIPVTRIGHDAFNMAKTITSVTIPESVTQIKSSAFSSCTALTSVSIPNSVTTIEDNAFVDCSALSSITLPDGLTSISDNLFRVCSNLTSVNIPAGVTTIGYSAFYDCRKLAEINIPEGVTSIGGYAFVRTALNSIALPSTIKNIGDYAFGECSQLRETHCAGDIEGWCGIYFVNEYSNPIRQSNNLFINGQKIIDLVIPSTVTTIGQYAFYGCSSFNSVTISEGVKYIGTRAFASCTNLASITLPTSIMSIGSYAFEMSGVYNDMKYNLDFNIAANSIEDYCNSETNELLQTHSGDSCLVNLLINGTKLTELTIPATVDTIPEYAFCSCNDLTKVTIQSSVQHIGNKAFANLTYCLITCQNPTPASIGTDVVTGDQWFLVSDVNAYKSAWSNYANNIIAVQDAEREVNVTALNKKSAIHVALGDINTVNSVVDLKVNGTINSYDIMMLRNQMPNLRILDLSDANILAHSYEYTDGYCSQDSILTSYAFTGTGTKIRKLTLPKSLKAIHANTINNQVQELTIHHGTIADSAFVNCTGLRKVVLDPSITAIEHHTFYNCSSLAEATIPGVKTIGAEAFKNCYALRSIALPTSLERIEMFAFRGAGLTSVTIPANVSHLGVGAFAGRNEEGWGQYYAYYSSASAADKTEYHMSTGIQASDYRAYWQTDYNNWNPNTGNYEQVWYEDWDNRHCYICGSYWLKEVTIPENSKLTTIPSRAFEGNENLTTLNIQGKKITTIGDAAFRRCALDTLILPPNLQEMSTLSFGYCSGLQFVAMPKTLESIAANAFVGCTNLKNVQFPSKLVHIGHHAFADCTNLENVDVPGRVTSIGDYAFKDCNVKDITSYLFDPFTIGQNTFSAYANANAWLHIPNVDAVEMKYLYDTQWSQILHRDRLDKTFQYEDFYATGDVVIGREDDAILGTPDVDLKPGSGLVVEDSETEQNLGNIIISSQIGDWASLIAGCNMSADTLFINVTVEGRKWHFLGFPFQIEVADILTDVEFVVYEYDGAMRAERDTTGWKQVPNKQSVLYPGKGYIFQFDSEEEVTFSLQIAAPVICEFLQDLTLAVHPSATPSNLNWNYLSNPLMAYYHIEDLEYSGPITFWDVNSNTYHSLRPGDDDYYISPYEAFFLQNKEDHEGNIHFDPSKAVTKTQIEEQRASMYAMPAENRMAAADDRAIINLSLTDGKNTDNTRVVINADATLNYDLGADAAKFFSTEQVPQLYTIDQTNAACAINERPMANGVVKLGVKLPAAGQYTIAANRMDTEMYLVDHLLNIVHDFEMGDYEFNAAAGTNSTRFELVNKHQAPTGIDNVNGQYMIEMTQDGIYVHGTTHVQVYNTAGQTIVNGEVSGAVALTPGVYMVVANGNTTKHIIK